MLLKTINKNLFNNCDLCMPLYNNFNIYFDIYLNIYFNSWENIISESGILKKLSRFAPGVGHRFEYRYLAFRPPVHVSVATEILGNDTLDTLTPANFRR